MATVRMSKVLQDEILKNFKQQCATAYANNNGVGDFMDDVYSSIHPSNFIDVINSWCEYTNVINKFAIANNLEIGWRGNIKIPELPFYTEKNIYFIVNSLRPDAENRTQLDTWARESYNSEPVANREIYPAENFVQGDKLIRLRTKDIPFPSVFTENQRDIFNNMNENIPFVYPPSSDNHYYLHDDFRDNIVKVNYPIVISTQQDVDRFQTVAEGTFKTEAAVENMEAYLLKLKTLKQFVDNWPGAENLVPQEYMKRHATKTVRKKSVAEEIPELPDELKSDVNAAILENKLVGDL